MNVRKNSDGYVRISELSQKDEVMGSEGRLIKFDMKHHIRAYRNIVIFVSILLLIPVVIVSVFNDITEGLKLAFFFFLLVFVPLYFVMRAKISMVKKAFDSEVMSGRLGSGGYLEPSNILISDSGDQYHIRGVYNLHPMLRHRCKFVRYKKVAWVIEMDTSKDTPIA